MQKKIFWAILALVGLFAVSLIGCGGGGSGLPADPGTPIPLTASAVKPDPGETVSNYCWLEIIPPDPSLEYGVGVADQDGGIPYGTWSVSVNHGVAENLAPGDFHIPKGATHVLFVAHNGWVGRLDPGKTFTVVLFTEKNGIVDPRVDWQWTFTVDPSLPADCGEPGANCPPENEDPPVEILSNVDPKKSKIWIAGTPPEAEGLPAQGTADGKDVVWIGVNLVDRNGKDVDPVSGVQSLSAASNRPEDTVVKQMMMTTDGSESYVFWQVTSWKPGTGQYTVEAVDRNGMETTLGPVTANWYPVTPRG